MIPRLPVAIALLLTGCAAEPPSLATTVPLDQDFVLPVGTTVGVSGTDLVLRFVLVSEDSRCPEDVQCVTAGDATVRLAAREDRGRELAVELRLAGEASEVRLGAYRVRLQGLAPRPRSGQPLPSRDYVATLRVRPS